MATKREKKKKLISAGTEKSRGRGGRKRTVFPLVTGREKKKEEKGRETFNAERTWGGGKGNRKGSYLKNILDQKNGELNPPVGKKELRDAVQLSQYEKRGKGVKGHTNNSGNHKKEKEKKRKKGGMTLPCGLCKEGGKIRFGGNPKRKEPKRAPFFVEVKEGKRLFPLMHEG